MKWTVFLIFLSVTSYAEQTKTVFNPFTGKLDYITVLSSSTLPSGSTQYIQNTFTPTTTTQVFSVQQGSFSVAGFYMMDSDNCRWQTTVATTGSLVTTLIGCPTAVVSTFRPCTAGMSLGLLLAITCP